MTRDELRRTPGRQLRALLDAGHDVDPAQLEGWAYRGTVLGLPRLAERLTWQTFQKAFHRLDDGRLVGWNVRLEQRGLDAPSAPLRTRGGDPVVEWPFAVHRARERTGLVIDYAPFASRAAPLRFVEDPLVALSPGDPTRLLGVSDVVVGPARLTTPTWFLLEREHRLSGPAPALVLPRPPLTATERRWAQALFTAILGVPVDANDAFWRRLAASAPAIVPAGLRAAVATLTFLPVTMRGFGRPFFALDERRRLDCIGALDGHSAVAHQLVSILKVLAAFAHFEAPGVRSAAGAQQ